MEKRFCYYVNPGQDPEEHGGYVPAVVYEDQPGYYPLTGKGEGATAWVWGKTLAQAEEMAEVWNWEKLHLNDKEVQAIIDSSIRASFQGAK
jgi:hypothetical protein